ncbi:MAG TPA: hypothetical protein VF832_15530 [Longimicrobiales bacterium]
MTSRQEARREVAALLEEFWVAGASTAAGTGTTLTDAVNLRFVNRGALYQDGYLLRTGGAADAALTIDDRVRQISVDTPATGVLTVDPPWTHVPPQGTPYEVWPSLNPIKVEAALNRVMAEMPTLRMVDIPATALNRYALSAYSWFQRADQFVEVRWGSPTNNPGEFDWHVLPGVTVDHDQGSGWSLYLASARPAVGTQLRLVAWGSWADVGTFSVSDPAADSVLVSAVPLRWLAARAALEVLSSPAVRRTSPESAGAYETIRRELVRRVAILDSWYVGMMPRRMFGPSLGPDQLVSPSSSSGRPDGL